MTTNSSRPALRSCIALYALALLLTPTGCPPESGGDYPLSQLGDLSNSNNSNVAGDTSTNPTASPQTDDAVGTLAGAVEIAPASLEFAVGFDEQQLMLTPSSDKAISLELSSNAAWLNVEPAQVELAGGPKAVRVTVDRAGMTNGVHVAAITVRHADYDPIEIAVSMAVGEDASDDGAQPTPVSRLEITPTSLDFATSRRSLSFLVRNRGDGEMTYAATTTTNWITIQNGSGSSGGQYQSVGVTVERAGLSPGVYAGAVDVAADGEQRSIPVSMVVEETAAPNDPQGALSLSHDELDFGGSQASLSLLVRYTGAGRVNYFVQDDVSWASADVTSGTNGGEYDTIRVTVSRAGLSAGTYEGLLTVALEDGRQRTVRLRLLVPAGPETPAEPDLWVSSDLLDFGSSQSTLMFRLRNTGGGSFLYTVTAASPDDEWITVSPPAGESAGEEDVITVTIDRAYLITGITTSTLTVLTTTGQTKSITLVVSVTYEPPVEPEPPNLVEWPNSDQNISYVVMMQQYAIPNLGPWSCCPTSYWGTNRYLGYVTMWIEPQHTLDDLAALFAATKQAITAAVPNAVYCTYISGGDCRRYEHIEQWPWTAIPYEEMPPGSFMTPYREEDRRVTVDFSNMNTVTLFADKIIAETRGRGCPVVWMDNVRHPWSGGTNSDWPTMAWFLSRIQYALHQDDIRLCANMAIVPFGVPRSHVEDIPNILDGICLEMPFWYGGRSSTASVVADIDIIRYWLDEGMHVEMIPHWWPEGGTREEAYRFIAGMIMIIRRPGDSIFTGHEFFRPPPSWAMWPAEFGLPLGDYTIIANDPPVFRREFEHATLTVDVGATLNGATHGAAVSIVWR